MAYCAFKTLVWMDWNVLVAGASAATLGLSAGALLTGAIIVIGGGVEQVRMGIGGRHTDDAHGPGVPVRTCRRLPGYRCLRLGLLVGWWRRRWLRCFAERCNTPGG